MIFLYSGRRSYFDGDEARPILHEGHVSEVFVPYMDPAESWAFRTYLDAGEFGLGTLVSPLVPGVDCPPSAAYLEAHHLAATARIVSEPRAVCIFPEPLRGPVWRHYEALNDLSAGVSGHALVVRSISSIAHYDYIFDWVFGPTGEIEIRIGATGVDAVKALAGHGDALKATGSHRISSRSFTTISFRCASTSTSTARPTRSFAKTSSWMTPAITRLPEATGIWFPTLLPPKAR